LVEERAQQHGTDDGHESEVIGAAQDLRSLLRPLV
jgi:hypothetical protein